MHLYYGLDENKNVVPISASEAEMLFSSMDERRVDETCIGPYRVSTVFLSIPHGSFYLDESEAFFFETMVFDEDFEPQDPDGFGECHRYRTWQEAVEGHKKVVRAVKLYNDVMYK